MGQAQQLPHYHNRKLLAEKRSASVCQMPHTRGTATNPFKLRGSHKAHGDHGYAPEQFEHSLQNRGSVPQFVGARLAVEPGLWLPDELSDIES